DPVLGAQVAHEDRDDQGIGFVAGHLDEAAGAEIPRLVVLEVAEVLHLEKAARLRARDPRLLAAPSPGFGERLELLVHTLQAMLRKAVQAVVEYPSHAATSLPAVGGGRERRIKASCHGGACTASSRRSGPAQSRNSPRAATSRKVRWWSLRSNTCCSLAASPGR